MSRIPAKKSLKMLAPRIASPLTSPKCFWLVAPATACVVTTSVLLPPQRRRVRRAGPVHAALSRHYGGLEVQVLGDAPAVGMEGVTEQADAALRLRKIVHAEVDVEQVDVPRQLDGVEHVGLDDLACDRQRRRLRVVVDVTVAGGAQLLVFLG